MGHSDAEGQRWLTVAAELVDAQLRQDAKFLGLQSRTEIVKAVLELLHRHGAEERMARTCPDTIPKRPYVLGQFVVARAVDHLDGRDVVDPIAKGCADGVADDLSSMS
ncbi:MAG: hypothetical protein ACR2GM_11710 [Nocardioidaceae bacterium]